MDRTITAVAENIKHTYEVEGRLTEKDADVLVTRLVHAWSRANVMFDQRAFYEACGLDIDSPVEDIA